MWLMCPQLWDPVCMYCSLTIWLSVISLQSWWTAIFSDTWHTLPCKFFMNPCMISYSVCTSERLCCALSWICLIWLKLIILLSCWCTSSSAILMNVFLLSLSSRNAGWKNSADDRDRGPSPVSEISRDLPQSANSAWTWSSTEDLWWVLHCLAMSHITRVLLCIQLWWPSTCRRHPRTVLRPPEAVWVWWIPPWIQLSLSRRLCGSGKAIIGVHLSAAGVQNQIFRELLSAEGQPWMCQHQSNLWLLWWMWVSYSICYVMAFNFKYPMCYSRQTTF